MKSFLTGLAALSLLGAGGAHALTVADLMQPESVVVDQKTGDYYVSNVAGGVADKDGNGYISRVSADGLVVVLKFIESKPDAFELHAPKGLLIHEGLLWVVDLDGLKAFNAESGEFVRAIALPDPKFLNDIVAGPDGMLYVSDMLADRIYKIDPKAADKAPGAETVEGAPDEDGVSIFKEGEDLGQPNGLCFNRFTKNLMAVSWKTGNLIEIDSNGAVRTLKTGFDGPDGLASDRMGTLYVSSYKKGEIYSISNWGRGQLALFQSGLDQPADVFYDVYHRELQVPVMGANALASFPVEEKRTRARSSKRQPD